MPKEEPQSSDIEVLKSRNKFQKIQFSTDRNNLLANIYLPSQPQKERSGVLFVHGGGLRGKSTFKSLQRQFLGKSLASLAYDSSGFGGSEGDRSEETLDTRLEDADAAFDILAQHVNPDAVSVVGVSMGADIAIRLLGRKRIKRLVLLSPAIYAEKDRNDPINLGFTRRLRRDRQSWQDAPGFSDLEAFSGQALIVYGTRDNIIPSEMQERFKIIAETREWPFVMLEGAPHNLLRPHTHEEMQTKRAVVAQSADFLARE